MGGTPMDTAPFTKLVESFHSFLRTIHEDKASVKLSADKWSLKEMVGHLIDSASNNHQRFVRLQLTDQLTFPDYGQNNIHWVGIQKYQERSWTALLDL